MPVAIDEEQAPLAGCILLSDVEQAVRLQVVLSRLMLLPDFVGHRDLSA
jgi:hypothetical protein